MTVNGKIDCLLPAIRPTYGLGSASRSIMKATYEAMEYFAGLGLCERIAWFKGNVGPPGWPATPGSDWPNGANPFGTNAWALYKFPPTAKRTWPWWFHFQVSGYTHAFGVVNHPAKLNASAGGNYESFGYQCARGKGSTNTIWNGSTNNNGTDTKGATPYWVTPAGGTSVVVLPRSNGTGGAHAASKENFAAVFNTDPDFVQRISYITNGEALAIVYSKDNGASYNLYYSGPLVVDPDYTSGVLAMLHGTMPLSITVDYGSTAGSSITPGGVDADQERIMRIDRLETLGNSPATFQPSKHWSPNRYDKFDIPVLCYETAQGVLGKLDPELVKEAYCIGQHNTSGVADWAFFSNGSTTNAVIALAWDGTTTPGTTASHDGVNF